MIPLDASHPPAGATTLIVSLGIITRLPYLAVIELVVLVVIIQAFCIHRLAGLPYPVWSCAAAATTVAVTRRSNRGAVCVS